MVEESENSGRANRAVKDSADEDVPAEQQVTVSTICEKPMKAFWTDDCLPNQSNHHQTEIPAEPEKSHSSDSFPSFGRNQGHPDVISILLGHESGL